MVGTSPTGRPARPSASRSSARVRSTPVIAPEGPGIGGARRRGPIGTDAPIRGPGRAGRTPCRRLRVWSSALRPRTSESTSSCIRTDCSGPGNVPASTSEAYAFAASRIVNSRCAYGFACRGMNVPSPSRSVITWTCPEHPAPAPMPIVGMCRRCVIAAASCSGTSSRTTAKAPASCTASASASSDRARSRSLPWTRVLPPIWYLACGVQPMCPMTGTPARTIVSMTRALRTPPSTLTAPVPASCMKRPAFGHGVVRASRRTGTACRRRSARASPPERRPWCGGASRPSTRGRWTRSRAAPRRASPRRGASGSRPRRRCARSDSRTR